VKPPTTVEKQGLYARLVGGAWGRLPEPVRRLHPPGSSVRGAGRFDVRHGRRLTARLLARLMGVPAAGEGVAVVLTVEPEGAGGERWHRSFDGRPFITHQREHPPGLLADRAGPVEMYFRMEAEGGALVYQRAGVALRLGPLRLPLPRSLAPRVEAREWAEPGDPRVCVRVSVSAPLVGPLVNYEGRIELEGD
jgi:hypothetical protein